MANASNSVQPQQQPQHTVTQSPKWQQPIGIALLVIGLMAMAGAIGLGAGVGTGALQGVPQGLWIGAGAGGLIAFAIGSAVLVVNRKRHPQLPPPPVVIGQPQASPAPATPLTPSPVVIPDQLSSAVQISPPVVHQPLIPIASTAAQPVPTPAQALASPIPSQFLQKFADYIATRGTFTFILNNTEYCAWVAATMNEPGYYIINIQRSSNWRAENSEMKLGLKFTTDGVLSSIRFNNQPQSVLGDKAAWIQAAYDKYCYLNPKSPQAWGLEVSEDDLKQLTLYLKQHHREHPNRFDFTINEVAFCAWFHNDDIINIQLKSAFGSSQHSRVNPQLQQNKLGIRINAQGQILSAFTHGKVSEIPDQMKQWLKPLSEKARVAESARAAEEAAAAPQFLHADLVTFRRALETATLEKILIHETILIQPNTTFPEHAHLPPDEKDEVEDGITKRCYRIWYKPEYHSINIQDSRNWYDQFQSNKLGIVINPQGIIQSIWLNGVTTDSNRIPEELIPFMQTAFRKALEISSTYKMASQLEIKIIRRGLQEVPLYHLQQFTLKIKENSSPNLRVSFLGDAIVEGQGIDAGGLSRDYLNDLMTHSIRFSPQSFQKLESSSLLAPRTQKNYEDNQPLPALTEKESKYFQQIGNVLMFAYKKNSEGRMIPVGRHFDDAIFKAILSLNENEIDASFNELQPGVHYRLAKALAEGYELGHIRDMAEILLKANPTVADIEQAVIFINATTPANLPPDISNDDRDELELDKIKEAPHQWPVVLTLLEGVLFSFSTSKGTLGTQIAPLHAIAKGMLEISRKVGQSWNQLTTKTPQELSTKIQGCFDRNKIINEMTRPQVYPHGTSQSHMNVFIMKVVWLNKWLSNLNNTGATDEEFRDFIKWVTGSSSLPEGEHIKISMQHGPYEVIPKIHSCFSQIELSPVSTSGDLPYKDDTEENFIKMIQYAIKPEVGNSGYSAS